jgi:hypothetical protein
MPTHRVRRPRRGGPYECGCFLTFGIERTGSGHMCLRIRSGAEPAAAGALEATYVQVVSQLLEAAVASLPIRQFAGDLVTASSAAVTLGALGARRPWSGGAFAW